MTNDVPNHNTSCACGPGCCQPAPPSGSAKIPKRVLLIVIGLAVAGLVVRGVLRQSPAPGAVAVSAPGAVAVSAPGDAARQARQANTRAIQATRASGVASASELDRLVGSAGAAFVMLPGADVTAAQDLTGRVTSILLKLQAGGTFAEAYTLSPQAVGYDAWVTKHKVGVLPAIVIFGGGAAPVVASGDLSEERLLRSFLQAARKVPSCGGAASSDGTCDCNK